MEEHKSLQLRLFRGMMQSTLSIRVFLKNENIIDSNELSKSSNIVWIKCTSFSNILFTLLNEKIQVLLLLSLLKRKIA